MNPKALRRSTWRRIAVETKKKPVDWVTLCVPTRNFTKPRNPFLMDMCTSRDDSRSSKIIPRILFVRFQNNWDPLRVVLVALLNSTDGLRPSRLWLHIFISFQLSRNVTLHSNVRRRCATELPASVVRQWHKNFACTWNDVSLAKLDYSIFAIGIPKFFRRNFDLNWQIFHIFSFQLSYLIVNVSFSLSHSLLRKLYTFVISIIVVNGFRSVPVELSKILDVSEPLCVVSLCTVRFCKISVIADAAVIINLADVSDVSINLHVTVLFMAHCSHQSIHSACSMICVRRFACQYFVSVIIFGLSLLVSQLLPPRWVHVTQVIKRCLEAQLQSAICCMKPCVLHELLNFLTVEEPHYLVGFDPAILELVTSRWRNYCLNPTSLGVDVTTSSASLLRSLRCISDLCLSCWKLLSYHVKWLKQRLIAWPCDDCLCHRCCIGRMFPMKSLGPCKNMAGLSSHHQVASHAHHAIAPRASICYHWESSFRVKSACRSRFPRFSMMFHCQREAPCSSSDGTARFVSTWWFPSGQIRLDQVISPPIFFYKQDRVSPLRCYVGDVLQLAFIYALSSSWQRGHFVTPAPFGPLVWPTLRLRSDPVPTNGYCRRMWNVFEDHQAGAGSHGCKNTQVLLINFADRNICQKTYDKEVGTPTKHAPDEKKQWWPAPRSTWSLSALPTSFSGYGSPRRMPGTLRKLVWHLADPPKTPPPVLESATRKLFPCGVQVFWTDTPSGDQDSSWDQRPRRPRPNNKFETSTRLTASAIKKTVPRHTSWRRWSFEAEWRVRRVTLMTARRRSPTTRLKAIWWTISVDLPSWAGTK